MWIVGPNDPLRPFISSELRNRQRSAFSLYFALTFLDVPTFWVYQQWISKCPGTHVVKSFTHLHCFIMQYCRKDLNFTRISWFQPPSLIERWNMLFFKGWTICRHSFSHSGDHHSFSPAAAGTFCIPQIKFPSWEKVNEPSPSSKDTVREWGS